MPILNTIHFLHKNSWDITWWMISKESCFTGWRCLHVKKLKCTTCKNGKIKIKVSKKVEGMTDLLDINSACSLTDLYYDNLMFIWETGRLIYFISKFYYFFVATGSLYILICCCCFPSIYSDKIKSKSCNLCSIIRPLNKWKRNSWNLHFQTER